MNLLVMAIAVMCCGTLLLGAEPAQQRVYRRIGGIDLKAYLFFPAGHQPSDRRPAIVLFHGGGFRSGAPSQFYALSAHLAQRGMVAICPEYRLEKHGAKPPDCVTDAKSALRWVRAHAGELGIDPERIVAGGGSAGGHLAAASAMLKGFDDPADDLSISPRPAALVLFNPVVDNGPNGFGMQKQLPRWQDFSPMEHVDASTPPTLFIVGDSDKLVPVSTARAFAKKLTDAGVRCDLRIHEGQEHGFFNREPFLSKTIAEADDFLVSLGYLRTAE